MRQNWWAFIENVADDLSPLRSWYYTSTKEEERLGDVASLPFENIYFHKIPFGETHFDVNVYDIDPFQYPLCIIYMTRQLQGELYVIGSISWQQLFDAKGKRVNINQCVKTRMFLTSMFDDGYDNIDDETLAYYLPVVLPRSADLDTHVPFDVVRERIDRYIKQTFIPNKNIAEDCVGVMMSSLVVAEIGALPYPGMRIYQEMYNELRMSYEYQAMAFAFERIQTESQVLSLLIANNLRDYMQEIGICDPTLRDKQVFFLRYPGCKPPTLMFCVAAEEVPSGLKPLPIYENGIAHISYKEVYGWIWGIFVQQNQNMAAKRCFDERIIDEARRFVRTMFNRQVARKPVVTTITNGQTNKVDPSVLSSFMPPCFKRIMEASRFPKHKERLYIVSTLKEANVDQTTVFEWLEQKHASFPQGGSAKARFDYQRAWDSNLGATYCKNIIQDTIRAKQDVITCPFVNNQSHQMSDIEDLKVSAQCQCAPTETTKFNGPKNLIKRALFRKK